MADKKEKKKRGPLSAYAHQKLIEFLTSQKYPEDKNKPTSILNKHEKGLFKKKRERE